VYITHASDAFSAPSILHPKMEYNEESMYMNIVTYNGKVCFSLYWVRPIYIGFSICRL